MGATAPVNSRSARPMTRNGSAKGIAAVNSSSTRMRELTTRAQYAAGTVRRTTRTVVSAARTSEVTTAPRTLGSVAIDAQWLSVYPSGSTLSVQRVAIEYSATA